MMSAPDSREAPLMNPIRRLLFLAVSVTAPIASLAQVPSKPADPQEPIPRELVMALLNLGPGMGGGSDIRVGQAPDDAPPELLPPGYQILGSTTQFENMVIVLAAPQQPDSAIAAMETKLLASGWTKPPTPNFRPMRGFVSADIGQVSYQPADMLCHGDAFVSMSGTYRRSGGSIIKLSYNRGQRYSACKQRTDVTVVRNPYEESPMPLLRAPQGSITSEGGGMSMGSYGITTGTRLKTKLKAAEVAAHYDKQMKEQGWMPVADGAVEFFAARSYRKTDDKQKAWTAILVSMNSADAGEQDVSLRLISKQ
jgi:hypothetical protein